MNLYHIETRSLKKSKTYYLKKTIRIKDRVYSIRTKIGKEKPTQEEEKKLVQTPNLILEKKILEKRLELCTNYYKPKYLDSSEIQRLEKTKHWELFFDLFLTESELQYFEETRRINYVHGTTAIEGNTFSLQQVDELLNRQIIPSSKSLREINEIQNYVSVENYVNEYSGKISIKFIRKLHELIMDNIDFESAGRFRRINSIGIRGVDVAVSPAILIESELERIINQYYSNLQNAGHPFEEAVMFHYFFEAVHPFTDGNGRVGRMLLNFILIKKGYFPIIIRKTHRNKYLKALHSADINKDIPLIRFSIEKAKETYRKFFEIYYLHI